MRAFPSLVALSFFAAAGCNNQAFTVDVPLRVVSIEPGGATVHVARSVVIEASFSEDLDPASVTGGEAFTLEALASGEAESGEAVVGTVTYDAQSFVASFTPESPLAYSGLYRVTLTTDIQRKRDKGPLPIEVTTTFQVMDPPPLLLVSASPGDGSTDVAREGDAGNPPPLTLTFCEGLLRPADDQTLLDSAIVVEDVTALAGPYDTAQAGTAIAGTLAFVDGSDPDGSDDPEGIGTDKVLSFTPNALLPYATIVRVTLKAGDESLAGLNSDRATSGGGQLAEDQVIVFSIEGLPPLQLLATAPSDKGTGIIIASDFDLVFGEDVDCTSLSDNLSMEFAATDPFSGAYDGMAGPNTVFPGSVSDCTGALATFTPSALDANPDAAPGYEYSRDIKVTLPTSICSDRHALLNPAADQTQGCFENEATLSYSLEDPDPLLILVAHPSDGAANIPRGEAMSIQFSEDIENASGASVTCSATCQNTVGASVVDDTLTFTPTTPDWRYSETITVSLPGGDYVSGVRSTRATPRGGFLVDATTSWSFDVEDMQPMVLLGSNAAGATSFGRGLPIELIFWGGPDSPSYGAVDCSTVSESVPATPAAGTIYIFRTDTGSAGNPATHLVSTLTCPSGTANKVLLEPVDTSCNPANTGLCFNSEYEVVISDQVCHAAKATDDVGSDNDGCIPTPGYSFAFTTLLPEGLRVTQVTPNDGDQGVDDTAGTVFTVEFNNLVDITTVTAEPASNDGVLTNICVTKGADLTTNCDAGVNNVDSIDVVPSDSGFSDTVSFTLPVDLDLSTDYTIVVTKDVEDEHTDRLDSFFTSTFRTKATELVDRVEATPLDDIESLEVVVLFSRDIETDTVQDAGIYLTYVSEDGRTVVVPTTLSIGERTGNSCSAPASPGNCVEATNVDCDCAVLTPSLGQLIGCQGKASEAVGIDGVVGPAPDPAFFSSASWACNAGTDPGKYLVIDSSINGYEGSYRIDGCGAGDTFVLGGADFLSAETEVHWHIVDAEVPLPYSTEYSAHLVAVIRSADGTMHVEPPSGNELVETFTTESGPLVTSLTFSNGLIDATALHGADDVPYNATIRVAVSEPLLDASLDGDNATVSLRSVHLRALESRGTGETEGFDVIADAPGAFSGVAENPGHDNIIVGGISAEVLSISADGRVATTDNDFGNWRAKAVSFTVTREQDVAVDVNYSVGDYFFTIAPAMAATPDPEGLMALFHPGTEFVLTLRGKTRTNSAFVEAADGEFLRGGVVARFVTSPAFGVFFHPTPRASATDTTGAALTYIDFTRTVHRPSIVDSAIFADQGGPTLSALLAVTIEDDDAALYIPLPTWDYATDEAHVYVTAAVLDERGNPVLGDATGGCAGLPCTQVDYNRIEAAPSGASLWLPDEIIGVREPHDTADAAGEGDAIFKLRWLVDSNTDLQEFILPASVDPDSVTLCYDPGNDGCSGDEEIPYGVELFVEIDVPYIPAANYNGVYIRPDGLLDAAKGPIVRIEVDRTKLANLATFSGSGTATSTYTLDSSAPAVACANVAIDVHPGPGSGDLATNANDVHPESTFVASFEKNGSPGVAQALEPESVVDAHGGCRNATLTDTTSSTTVPLGCSLCGSTLTITPLSSLSLDGDTAYELVFGTGIRDTELTALGGAVTCAFRTVGGAASSHPLTLLDLQPTGGAETTTANVVATFNYPLDVASVVAGTSFRVLYDTGAGVCGDDLDINGCLTFSDDYKQVTFDAAEDLGLIGSMTYDVSLTAAIEDQAKSSTFADTTSDDLFSTGDGAPVHLCTVETAPSGNPVLALHFNEALNVGTVTADSVWLYIIDTVDDADEGDEVTSVAIDTATAAEVEITIDLATSNLDSGDTYGLIVTQDVTDAAANGLVFPVHEYYVAP